MLRDAAAIQVSDARYLNRRAEEQGSDEPRVEPLYETTTRSRRSLPLPLAAPYHHPIEIAPGRAAHPPSSKRAIVLGSAVSLLDVVEGDAHRRVA